MISALFVEKNGHYFNLPGVDPWDETRDARTYRGPYPVIAHPPCARWCRMAGLVEKRYGYLRGDDGGCFESALKSVREWGGVLEHPAYSTAWERYGLGKPKTSGGWELDLWGGAVCHVEQGHYGHNARKATWLYSVGCDLPSLVWGASETTHMISYCSNRTDIDRLRPRISGKKASRTPTDFRDILIKMAESCLRNS